MLSDDRSRASAGEWFREAARDRGYNAATVVGVWEVLESFGGFGFCKAHAAAFAVPTYQSAWLKRHYPAAFYAGVLTHDPGMYPKRVIVGDARLAGIPILPVDVNASAGDWCVERVPQLPGEGLRPGLREVKGISEAEVARIVAGQPYTSLRDLWERAAVSRPVTERLVLVGALDSLYDPDEPDAEPGGAPRGRRVPCGGVRGSPVRRDSRRPGATCWPGSGSWTAARAPPAPVRGRPRDFSRIPCPQTPTKRTAKRTIRVKSGKRTGQRRAGQLWVRGVRGGWAGGG